MSKFRLGSSQESRQDGRLLSDNFLEPERFLWKQKGCRRRYHREPSQLPHLRRTEHFKQHLTLRPSRCWSLQRLFPPSPTLRFQAARINLHLLPRLPARQARHCHRLWAARACWQIQEAVTKHCLQKTEPLDLPIPLSSSLTKCLFTWNPAF